MPDEPNDRKRSRSPALGLPLGGSVSDPASIQDTSETIRILGRRAHDTEQKVGATLDRVGELRKELTGRIDQLDAKVDGLAVSSARVEGQVDILVEEMRAGRQVRVTAAQAVIEVEKTGEIAKVNEAVAVRADRRQLLLKIAAGVGPILAALATALLAGKC